MGHSTILGIDPGIANTGLSIVQMNAVNYSLIAAETIKTSPRYEMGKRLSIIQDEIHATLNAWKIDAIAIERVFPQQKYLQLSDHWRGPRSRCISSGIITDCLSMSSHHNR